jgi:hypothetical protein
LTPLSRSNHRRLCSGASKTSPNLCSGQGSFRNLFCQAGELTAPERSASPMVPRSPRRLAESTATTCAPKTLVTLGGAAGSDSAFAGRMLAAAAQLPRHYLAHTPASPRQRPASKATMRTCSPAQARAALPRTFRISLAREVACPPKSRGRASGTKAQLTVAHGGPWEVDKCIVMCRLSRRISCLA